MTLHLLPISCHRGKSLHKFSDAHQVLDLIGEKDMDNRWRAKNEGAEKQKD